MTEIAARHPSPVLHFELQLGGPHDHAAAEQKAQRAAGKPATRTAA